MRHAGNGKCPRHWNSYLQSISNNVELFLYLSVYIAQTVFCDGRIVQLMSTLDENVLGSPDANESEYPFMPYNHEEFELHATNAVSRG